MQKFSFSDEDLKRAASAVCDAMLAALPDPAECNHVFSAEFEEKMDLLIAKEERRSKTRKILQRVAAAALAVVIGIGAWLAVDQEARAAVFRWIREVYESSVLYRFTGETPSGELPVYRPTWLPDGYEETAVVGTETVLTLVYQKNEDAFTLTYHWMTEERVFELIGTDGEGIAVWVGNNQGRYYPALNHESTNDLVWIDEEANIMFTLSAFLSEKDILHIAESTELSKTPK